MKVAVFGCLHGKLNEMYDEVLRYEKTENISIEIIIVCGDCQTIRHFDDLKCLSVPNKYKKVGDFPDYYSGAKKIPRLTIMVGGNHEASNYLMTLPYGGWVCDNFYYLGYAGVIKYRGLRIAGVSGIYNRNNCNRGRFERLPLDNDSIKSIYHTRRLDVFRLALLSINAQEKNPIDIMISHDWPARVYNHGNVDQLLRYKPNFRQDVESREGLGSPITEPLIKQLKPKRWFAAHLHCRFYANVKHDKTGSRCTEFLSLGKIEPYQRYKEFLDIEPPEGYDISDKELYFDEEWLTVLRKTTNLEINSRNNVFCPRADEERGKVYVPTPEDIAETVNLMNKSGGLRIPRNFRMTEPVVYGRPDAVQTSLDINRERNYPNPQTEELCSRLNMNALKESNLKKTKPESSNSGPATQDDDVVEIKLEPTIKVEPTIKSEPFIKSETGVDVKNELNNSKQRPIKVEVKAEVKEEVNPPSKKRAVHIGSVVLDEDGCLPFYIDTRGDK